MSGHTYACACVVCVCVVCVCVSVCLVGWLADWLAVSVHVMCTTTTTTTTTATTTTATTTTTTNNNNNKVDLHSAVFQPTMVSTV